MPYHDTSIKNIEAPIVQNNAETIFDLCDNNGNDKHKENFITQKLTLTMKECKQLIKPSSGTLKSLTVLEIVPCTDCYPSFISEYNTYEDNTMCDHELEYQKALPELFCQLSPLSQVTKIITHICSDDFLSATAYSCPNIKELDFSKNQSRNKVTDRGLFLIAACPMLAVLKFYSQGVYDGVSSVGVGSLILHLPNLEVLEFETSQLKSGIEHVKENSGDKKLFDLKQMVYNFQIEDSDKCNWSTQDMLIYTMKIFPKLENIRFCKPYKSGCLEALTSLNLSTLQIESPRFGNFPWAKSLPKGLKILKLKWVCFLSDELIIISNRCTKLEEFHISFATDNSRIGEISCRYPCLQHLTIKGSMKVESMKMLLCNPSIRSIELNLDNDFGRSDLDHLLQLKSSTSQTKNDNDNDDDDWETQSSDDDAEFVNKKEKVIKGSSPKTGKRSIPNLTAGKSQISFDKEVTSTKSSNQNTDSSDNNSEADVYDDETGTNYDTDQSLSSKETDPSDHRKQVNSDDEDNLDDDSDDSRENKRLKAEKDDGTGEETKHPIREWSIGSNETDIDLVELSKIGSDSSESDYHGYEDSDEEEESSTYYGTSQSSDDETKSWSTVTTVGTVSTGELETEDQQSDTIYPGASNITTNADFLTEVFRNNELPKIESLIIHRCPHIRLETFETAVQNCPKLKLIGNVATLFGDKSLEILKSNCENKNIVII